MSTQILFAIIIVSTSVVSSSDAFSCSAAEYEDLTITGTHSCDIVQIDGTLRIESASHLSADRIEVSSTGSLILDETSTVIMNSKSGVITNYGAINVNGGYLVDTVLQCQSESVCTLICANSGCQGVTLNCEESALCEFECDEKTECPEYEVVSQMDERELVVANKPMMDEDVDGTNIRPMHHMFSTLNLMEIFAICSIVSFSLLGICVKFMRYKEKEYEVL